jgi:FkbM family methyltransferase
MSNTSAHIGVTARRRSPKANATMPTAAARCGGRVQDCYIFPMLATATKIRLARRASATLLRLGFRAQRQVRRNGIAFELDLREGIDLSLFLFGSFQRNVIGAIRRYVPPDGVVIDVGANIGAVTLVAATHLRNGHVYAFEPTDFAFAKLERNLALNPALASRVTTLKMFVADRSAPTSDFIAYSSWPVAGKHAVDEHPVHKGIAKAASCGQTTIDEFMAAQKPPGVSFIKIDTDGHEFSVLSGASQCLAQSRPIVLFEACAYLMKAPQPAFADFAELFRSHDYAICEGTRLEPIDSEEFKRQCPAGGGMDLIAVPKERSSGPVA